MFTLYSVSKEGFELTCHPLFFTSQYCHLFPPLPAPWVRHLLPPPKLSDSLLIPTFLLSAPAQANFSKSGSAHNHSSAPETREKMIKYKQPGLLGSASHCAQRSLPAPTKEPPIEPFPCHPPPPPRPQDPPGTPCQEPVLRGQWGLLDKCKYKPDLDIEQPNEPCTHLSEIKWPRRMRTLELWSNWVRTCVFSSTI